MTAVRLRLTNRVSRCGALLLGLTLLVAACSSGADDGADELPATNEPGIEAEESADAEGQDEPGQEAGADGEEAAEEELVVERILTDTFTPLGEPGVGGRITSIAFDPDNPDRVFVGGDLLGIAVTDDFCLLYTSPSPRDLSTSRMPSSA